MRTLNLRLLVGFIFCFTAQSRKFAVYAQRKSVLLLSRLLIYLLEAGRIGETAKFRVGRERQFPRLNAKRAG